MKKPSLFELTEPFIEPFEPEQRKMQAQAPFARHVKREVGRSIGPRIDHRAIKQEIYLNRGNLLSYGSDAFYKVSTRMFSHGSRCLQQGCSRERSRSPHCDNSVAALESSHATAVN